MILQSPILTFPGYILMIYAGFKFGLIMGTFINFIGLYLSCIIGYRFGKWSSIDLEKRTSPKMQKFHNWVEEKGIKAVAFLRVIPLIPNNITSIGSGFSRLSEKRHAVYSSFSILQSFFWSFLGSYMLQNSIHNLRLDITIYHILILILLIIFMVFFKLKFSNNDTSNIVSN